VIGPVRTEGYARNVTRPPTDFELLRAVYELHRERYEQAPEPVVALPVDIPAVAKNLGVEVNSVFGRLYHHLDRIYGERPDEKGRRRFFFTPKAGTDVNCINFPHLEAVLAELWQQRDRDVRTYWTAIASLVISAVAVVVSILVAAGAIR
jgi:hypothetical protein